MSKVFVLNAGSSSLKFKLYQASEISLKSIFGGTVQRIGGDSSLKAGPHGKEEVHEEHIRDHTAALDAVLQLLERSGAGDVSSVRAIGHRVVHGRSISKAMLVDDAVIQAIKDASDLAPLHNPANLEGILAVQKIFPGKPSVAVFDTAFHQTMPPKAFMYALPYDLYEQYGLRRYGAHGTSVQYLVKKASQMLQKPGNQCNLIVAHIGAGASITAIKNGKTLDTSMGMTPLEGLMMMTRCGDLDPTAVLYLQEHCGMSPSQVAALLNSDSGFKGLTGHADIREILHLKSQGNEEADLAIQVYIHRLRKYLGAYFVHLKGSVDAIIFSAGVGENSAIIRKEALADLQAFGIQIDDQRNEATTDGQAGNIEAVSSAMKIMVIPTDEEFSIAEQTLEVVSQL